jgi:hypothetical protein
MPVAGSEKTGTAAGAEQSGQRPSATASRRPQLPQRSRTSHSGHRRQFSLTFRPQPGHIGSDSAASHAGQIFHPGSTGSPHEAHNLGSSDIFHFMIVFVGVFSRS